MIKAVSRGWTREKRDASNRGIYASRAYARSLAGLSSATATATLLFAAPASAQGAGGSDPTAMVNNICNFILGPFGQSLAILGIVAIGMTWMFGRASLGLVAGVVGGIIIMFGASFLGQTLTGG